MSRQLNPAQIWSQVPVASRTVGAAASVTGAVGSVTGAVGSVTTVSDKTGYSLTAGSYSVRASSTQRGAVSSSSPSVTSTISSVTTTRATENHNGHDADPTTTHHDAVTRLTLTNSTTITISKQTSYGTPSTNFVVTEFF